MKRGRNQRRRQGSNPNRALDSNGPDVRIRGTANQIYDKYQALARDASSSGDRIKAESYLQHAEHYFRVIRSMTPAQSPQHQSGQDNDDDQPGMDEDDNDQRDHRQSRPAHRNGSNGADESVAEQPVTKPAESAAVESQPETAEEEKKPRRRRAPRRPVKAADNDGAATKDKTAAAAE